MHHFTLILYFHTFRTQLKKQNPERFMYRFILVFDIEVIWKNMQCSVKMFDWMLL